MVIESLRISFQWVMGPLCGIVGEMSICRRRGDSIDQQNTCSGRGKQWSLLNRYGMFFCVDGKGAETFKYKRG